MSARGPGGVRDPSVDHRRDDPVTGWRYWQLNAGSSVLRSVTQRRFQWVPGRPFRAVCVGTAHRSPDPSCRCGVYGARDLATLREHGLCLGPEVLVVGEVALWGRVIPDDRGYRGEFAYPRRLWVVEDAGPGAGPDLLAAYDVPVGTMPITRAVGDVSAATMAFQAMSRSCRPAPGAAGSAAVPAEG